MKRKKVYPMSLRIAANIYRKMSYVRHRANFSTYRKGYAYLLQLVADNERMINSLSMNNRALAKAVAKERENSGVHLRDKISTEKLYFDLINEHSIVKANLLNLEREIISIDEDLTTSMIPNLVRLSDDITNIKLKSGSLRETFSSLNPDKVPEKIWNRPQQMVRQYPQYSPIYEETENDFMGIGTRKCKGGFRNIFNLYNKKESGKRDTPNSKANCYNFVERNENSLNSNDSDTSSNHDCTLNRSETKQVSLSCSDFLTDQETGKENQINLSNTMNNQECENGTVSSLLSPKVVLRRVSRKTMEMKDDSFSSNSDPDCHNQSGSKPARRSSRRVASREEKPEQSAVRRSARSLSSDEDNNKRASLHSKREHSQRTFENVNVPESDLLRLNSSVEDEANNKFSTITERKKSSRRMSISDREPKPKKSKRFFSNSKTNETVIVPKTTELENTSQMTEFENTSQRSNIFANDSGFEISFVEGRSLRARSKTISYKEKPLKTKLRKH